MDKTPKKPLARMYKAQSWSDANGKASERQPHLFYRCAEADEAIDKIKADHREVVKRYEFELRKRDAIEAFYMKELRL